LLPTVYFKPPNETMPKFGKSKKPPPEGWELIEPTLDELDMKVRQR
jgi:hypothetical protein